jgi:hypothetical protein
VTTYEILEILLDTKKKGESKSNKNGCQKNLCRFDDIRHEAIANGRIKRPPGWFKFQLP